MSSTAYAVNSLATVINIEQKRADYVGNPQLDDGHTRIANELLEAILEFPFSSRQLKVVFSIIRKTYGFNKKEDTLAQSVLSDMTGIAKTHICTTLKELDAMKVVTIDATKFAHRIALNKRYKEWESSYRISNSYQIGSYQNGNELVTKTVTKPLPKQSPQKKERKKDNIKYPIPEDFGISVAVRTWADKHGHGQLEAHLDSFIDTAKARGYTYADWDAAFRKAIRENWGKIKPQVHANEDWRQDPALAGGI